MSEATGRRIPPAIWALGFVSLLMDIASEMVHSLLPVFLVSVIGATVTFVVGGAFAGISLMLILFYALVHRSVERNGKKPV